MSITRKCKVERARSHFQLRAPVWLFAGHRQGQILTEFFQVKSQEEDQPEHYQCSGCACALFDVLVPPRGDPHGFGGLCLRISMPCSGLVDAQGKEKLKRHRLFSHRRERMPVPAHRHRCRGLEFSGILGEK